MNFNSIDDYLEWLRTSGSYSDAVLDCVNAYRESKAHLENLFDSQLFMGEGYEFDNEADKQYFDELTRIEGILVASGLIYQD